MPGPSICLANKAHALSQRVFFFPLSCWLGSQAKVHSRVPSTLRSRVFSGFTFLTKPVQKLSMVAWDCNLELPLQISSTLQSLGGGACSVTGLRWWSANLCSLSVAEVEGSTASAHSCE